MEITKRDIQRSTLAQCITYLKLLGMEYQGQSAKKLKEVLIAKLVDGKLTIPGGEDGETPVVKNGAKVPLAKKVGTSFIKKIKKLPAKSKNKVKKANKPDKKKGETKTAKAIALFNKGWTARQVADELDMHPSFAHTVRAKLKLKK